MAFTINQLSTAQSPKLATIRLIWIAPLAMLVSTTANLGLYTAAGSLFPEVTAWTGASSAQIIGANVVYLLIGTFIFALVNWRSPQPIRHYWTIATIGLVFSFWMPISAGLGFGPPELVPASAITVITLCLMHILSYIISVPMFIRFAQK